MATTNLHFTYGKWLQTNYLDCAYLMCAKKHTGDIEISLISPRQVKLAKMFTHSESDSDVYRYSLLLTIHLLFRTLIK